MVERKMPRIQEVVIPLLRAANIRPGIQIVSWVPVVTNRTYPVINIRRLGGVSHTREPDLLDKPVIEMTVYHGGHRVSLEDAEDIYLDARQVLHKAVKDQVGVEGVGYLHSFFQTMGPIPLDSPFEDTWRIQGLIQLGLRPERT